MLWPSYCLRINTYLPWLRWGSATPSQSGTGVKQRAEGLVRPSVGLSPPPPIRHTVNLNENPLLAAAIVETYAGFPPFLLLQKLNLIWRKQSSVLNVNAFPSTLPFQSSCFCNSPIKTTPLKILPCNPINNNNNHSTNSYFCKLALIYFFGTCI